MCLANSSCTVVHVNHWLLPPPQDGWTPLHCASQGGHTAVVKFLLRAGAHADAQNQVRHNTVLVRPTYKSITLSRT
jgi:hypothetical protein